MDGCLSMIIWGGHPQSSAGDYIPSILTPVDHPVHDLRREAGDVWCLPPVWNLRAVIWFHFAISSLALLPSPVTLSVLSFSACWPFLLNFFRKILQYFSLRDRLFCMAPVQRLGEDSWSVVCAACCHMTLVFAVMHLYNILEFFIASVHSFFYTFFKNLVLINRRNGPRYQCVLALCAFSTCLESQGCHLIPLCYRFSCSSVVWLLFSS